jgi:hypothetical protein
MVIGRTSKLSKHRSGAMSISPVGDTHHADLATSPTAAIYTPQTQITDSFLVAVVKSSSQDAAALVAPLRAVLRGLDPRVPVYDVATMQALLAKASPTAAVRVRSSPTRYDACARQFR